MLAQIAAWRLIPAHAGKTAGYGLRATPPGAHPRSRGENRGGGSMSTELEGSSPLTRGKPPTHCRECGAERLIPAHAGKTTKGPRYGVPVWAHPRSRGENTTAALIGALTPGSSPLTRGKPTARLGCLLLARLIPAHAGKTHAHACADRRLAAHPRSRGENRGIRPSGHSSGGSSPLTRGKPGRWQHEHRAGGLIPAHAGKTAPSHAAAGRNWAHPRSRGEN